MYINDDALEEGRLCHEEKLKMLTIHQNRECMMELYFISIIVHSAENKEVYFKALCV